MKADIYPFKQATKSAVHDDALRTAIYTAATTQDAKRRSRAPDLPDLDALRTLAGRIKQHTLEHLDEYLERFIDAATAAGATVHYAAIGQDVHEIVRAIIRENDGRLIIKSKSMVSEEVELDAALEGLAEVVETDLGEFIVQIDHDKPSHIVTPIIHKTAKDVARIFQRELGLDYTEDPTTLAKHARRHLREKFRGGDIGITGVNFAVAETGSVVICTNEGNGRMCSTRPRVHIALMGVEKLIPRLGDLSVFLKLLGRSATGQSLTQYTHLVTGPRRAGELDGPERLHIVLIDRGRTANLAGEYRQTLRCIRCGACLNACPVYRNVGGHAYGSVYSGPIGILLTPIYDGFEKFRQLPHGTSLCGACGEVCPVKIPLPDLFIRMRAEQRRRKVTPLGERLVFKVWTLGLRGAWLYGLGQRAASWFTRWVLGRKGWIRWMPGPPGAWTRKRPMPTMAKKSFRRQWKRLRGEADTTNG